MGVIEGVISNTPCLKLMKSNRLPIKLHLPNNLPFPNTKPFPTSSFCSFSSFTLNNDKLSAKQSWSLKFAIFKKVFNLQKSDFTSGLSSPQIFSFVIDLLDEDGQVEQKIDEFAAKGTYDFDSQIKTNTVLLEVLPLLLEKAHLWISSRFSVSSNLKELLAKLDNPSVPRISNPEISVATHLPCIKVYVDISIDGAMEDKFKEIHTREDLKTLLHHLMSMQGVKSAFVVCLRSRVAKEKTKALEDYSHVTV